MDRIQPFKVLVFPSINEPGLEVIHALAKSNKVELYGGSSYDVTYDPSRLMLKNHLVLPDYYDPNFKEKFEQILARYSIDSVFPTMDILVSEFSTWNTKNVTYIVTNPESAGLCLSKQKVYQRLTGKIPVPHIFLDDNILLPAFAKPDIGSGSHDGSVIQSDRELQLARRRNLLITEYLPGDEYTVDCLNDLQGQLLFANIRIRGRIERSIAVGSRSVTSINIEKYIETISENIKIEGPWFAQFKLDKHDEPKLMEINVRVAGSMTHSRLSGINIPLASLFVFKGYPIRIPKKFDDVVMVRHLTDTAECSPFQWIFWDFDDTVIRKDGKPDPDIIACIYDCHNRGVQQFLITKNREVNSLLSKHHLPTIFQEVQYTEDKFSLIREIVKSHNIDTTKCVIVNDSTSENLVLQEILPNVRTVTPDSISVLGREQIA